MQPQEKANSKLKQMIVNNFIGGIAWGVGVSIGLSLIIPIMGIIFSKINLIPVVGDFVSQITSFVLQNNPHLVK